MEATEMLDSDLTTLDELTEQNILQRIKARYAKNLIYTCVKDILIAINPCKQIKIYNAQTHVDYGSDKFDSTLQPHVFQVATRAYRRLCDSETNQVIIVSGESGAGKTESTKHMVRHIVHMCQKRHMNLDQKIIEISPLLELFGNAKTSMNPNSSRFAKFLELTFNEDDQDIAGAVVRDYMLEKSRVVHQSRGEGNFHIFYALFAGCPRQKMNDLFLEQQASYYRILQSDKSSLEDKGKYRAMYDSNMAVLQKIGVDTEILHVILAAIINICEIKFEEGRQGQADIIDPAPFEHAAILLELDREEFGIALTTSKRTIRGQDIVSYKTVSQACDTRDSLAKMLYERIFGWLVRQINQDLHPNRQSSGKAILGNIGILDIAGFEKLKQNSLEQLCINLVNEKLQNFMNQRIFQIEMMIYEAEGVDMEGVKFENNDKTLELFEEKKGGILALLDETSKFLQGNDRAFVMELNKRFTTSPLFKEVKSDAPEFFIKHFAAKVRYNAKGFIEKNRDVLTQEMMECLKQSNDNLISDLFTVKRGPTGTISVPQNNFCRTSRYGQQSMSRGHVDPQRPPTALSLAEQLSRSIKTRFGTPSPAQDSMTMTQVKYVEQHKTLVSYFRASLLDLLDKLNSAEPFYVRCLKPNMVLAPNSFDDTIVLNQLLYNGITQIAKIRKMGFAVRLAFEAFIKNEELKKQLEVAENACRRKVDQDGFKVEFIDDYIGSSVFVTKSFSEGSFLLEYDGDLIKNYKYRPLLRPYKIGDSANTTRAILLQLPMAYHNGFRLGKTKVFMTHEVELFLGKLLHIRKKTDRRILLRLVPYMRRKIDKINERKLKGADNKRKLEAGRKTEPIDEKQQRSSKTEIFLGATLGGTLGKEEEADIHHEPRTKYILKDTFGKSVWFKEPETNIHEGLESHNKMNDGIHCDIRECACPWHERPTPNLGRSRARDFDSSWDNLGSDWKQDEKQDYSLWKEASDENSNGVAFGHSHISSREFHDDEQSRRFKQHMDQVRRAVNDDINKKIDDLKDHLTATLNDFAGQMMQKMNQMVRNNRLDDTKDNL